MNEIIKISERDGNRVVDARELYLALKIQSRFADWIKNRISQYGFIKDQDYISFSKILETGGKSREYGLSLDMAKELSMVENNEEGKKIRRYLIAVEKAAREQHTPAIPKTFAEALELAASQQRMIESKDRQISELLPKAEFADRAVNTDGLVEVSMACKVLDLPYGRNTFYSILRKANVFFQGRNEPLQRYIDMGYFKVKQKIIHREAHPPLVVNVPFLTEKGVIRMAKWLKERGYYHEAKAKEFLHRMN